MHLRALHLLAPDLLLQQRFYSEVLGLPTALPNPHVLVVHLGLSQLVFRQATPGSAPFYHFAIAVPHNLLREAHAWLAPRTPVLPFVHGEAIADFPNWRAQAFYFHDPAGNILEFIARFEVPNAAAGPFGAAQLLGLSEAGMATPNVPALAAELTAHHGIPDFFRGPKLPTFAALGTDDGLLILTQQGRGWLPTGRPAERHWLRIEGEHAGRSFVIEDTPGT
ncbi:hypothetical protein D3Y59_03610 [Hymenobacter oligotrophus]|uniref:VOC domain-containing protein n=1 Tax=Hymenobacter oligotrophus TaxID=2319843 RepID=A0A3B7QYR8_9BACT|nr:hypothetical protein [Hymenobacter oligotrophus]AYA36230.1 hypothetical protein D3Y59_03610 [Hymenobacter oligotrophus]